jgi:hypothetical protein
VVVNVVVRYTLPSADVEQAYRGKSLPRREQPLRTWVVSTALLADGGK